MTQLKLILIVLEIFSLLDEMPVVHVNKIGTKQRIKGNLVNFNGEVKIIVEVRCPH